MRILKSFPKQSAIQIAGLTALAFIIHALVLKFIFPGYYSPLYPHHSDFYISAALANSPNDFFQYRYLGYSRPVAIFFLKLIGLLGIHGAILFTVLNVMVNCAISATLFRRLLEIEFKASFVLLFCIYCYLLFSQPYFYTFYTQDVLAHLSYFFLITGAALFFTQQDQNFRKALLLLFSFSLVAFLFKETYMLAELFFALLGFAFHYKKKPMKIALSPLLVVMAAVGMVLIFNLTIKSIFINFHSTPTDPYYINLAPASIFKEIVLYAKEAFSFLHGIVIVMAGLGLLNALLFGNKQNRIVYLMIGCLFGIVLSWLPNALIPNHHHGGYSFNGNYFFYLPLLAIPLIKTQATLVRASIAMLLLVCVTTPLASKADYDNQWWVLEQEGTQRNLLRDLDTLMGDLASSGAQQKILVTGLTMPFYPFHHPLVLKEYPNSNLAVYDVVNYSIETEIAREDSVKFIKPSDVQLGEYTSVWMFAGDGSLLKSIALDQPTKAMIKANQYQDLVVHPDSEKAKILEGSLK
jgi:hypothetical protein